MDAFVYYFRINRKLNLPLVKTKVVMLRKTVLKALRRNLIDNLPFGNFHLEKTEVQDRSLSADELDKLITTPLKSRTQRFIRDMFVFSTFTGLSFADLNKLTWKDIVAEDDGSRWISTCRQKTKTAFNVKLLSIPVQIMERYNESAYNERIFPIMNLGYMNIGLKRIASNCKIDRTLTFHMSRHTFASQICISQDVPIESVSRMLGHMDIRTTQRYARISNEKIINDMKRLSNKISNIKTINT